MSKLTYHDDAQVTENTFRTAYAEAAEAYEKLVEGLAENDNEVEVNWRIYSQFVREVGNFYGHFARNGMDLPVVPPFSDFDSAAEALASQDHEVAFGTAATFWPDAGQSIPAAMVQVVRVFLDRRARGLSNVPRPTSDTNPGGRPGYLDKGAPMPGEVRSVRKRYPDVDERLTLIATLLHATCTRLRANAILKAREALRQAGLDAKEARRLLVHVEKVISGLEKSPKLSTGPRDKERLNELANHLGRIVNAAPQDADSEQTEAA